MTELETQTKSKAYYLGVLFIGILAVSTASIFIRFAQAEVPSLVIAAGRLLISTLVMFPFAYTAWRKKRFTLTGKNLALLLASGSFLGLHFAAWITSLELTTVTSSVVLVTTAPLWVALFSPLLLKEKLTKQIIIGLVVALCGSIVVSVSSNCSPTGGQLNCIAVEDFLRGDNAVGNLLAFSGALLSAAYFITGRKVRGTVDLPIYTFIVYGTASVILLIMVAISGQKVIGYSPLNYLWILALALIPQSIGHTAFNWALKFLPAAYVSIALLGEPVGTVILAALLLREAPTVLELLGGLLILAGITIATQRITAKKRTPA